jgi:hypothetical protein
MSCGRRDKWRNRARAGGFGFYGWRFGILGLRYTLRPRHTTRSPRAKSRALVTCDHGYRRHGLRTGSKTPGEPGHTHGTHRTHGRTRLGVFTSHTDHTDEPHNHPNPPTHPHARPRTTTETASDSTAAAPEPTAPRGRLSRGRPQRTRPLPDPAATRSQSASPRLLEGGRRNEGARGRRVAAGGAAGAPDELETREAVEAGVRYTAAAKPTWERSVENPGILHVSRACATRLQITV